MDYNARFYSPRLRRFTQPDTIIPGLESQALNRYSYTTNNPILYTDPSGHCNVIMMERGLCSAQDLADAWRARKSRWKDESAGDDKSDASDPVEEDAGGDEEDKKNNQDMGTSDAGIAVIMNEEKFVGCLYNDMEPAWCAEGGAEDAASSVGGHCTIGYGHLVHHGRCEGIDNVKEQEFPGAVISKEDAYALLLKDISEIEEVIKDSITGVQLTQNQFDALVIFSYNAGKNAVPNLGIDKDIEAGNIAGVVASMRAIDNSGGVYLEGLANRREMEINILLLGIYP